MDNVCQGLRYLLAHGKLTKRLLIWTKIKKGSDKTFVWSLGMSVYELLSVWQILATTAFSSGCLQSGFAYLLTSHEDKLTPAPELYLINTEVEV